MVADYPNTIFVTLGSTNLRPDCNISGLTFKFQPISESNVFCRPTFAHFNADNRDAVSLSRKTFTDRQEKNTNCRSPFATTDIDAFIAVRYFYDTGLTVLSIRGGTICIGLHERSVCFLVI